MDKDACIQHLETENAALKQRIQVLEQGWSRWISISGNLNGGWG